MRDNPLWIYCHIWCCTPACINNLDKVFTKSWTNWRLNASHRSPLLLLYAICYICYMLYVTCYVYYTCCMLHLICYMLNVICDMLHVVWLMPQTDALEFPNVVNACICIHIIYNECIQHTTHNMHEVITDCIHVYSILCTRYSTDFIPACLVVYICMFIPAWCTK